MSKIHMIGTKACGSVIAEIFLSMAEIPYEYEEVDYGKPGPGRDKLLSLNPLGQVPTLVLEDGTVLTETLAVAHYVHRLRPDLKLIPSDLKDFAKFQRWSIFLISSFYPTYTYGDTPTKWVEQEVGAKQLKQSTDEHRKKLCQVLEAECGSPNFLGQTFSAIDIYLAVFTNWRPGREWYQANAPKIFSLAQTVSCRPEVSELWTKNFSS